MEEHTLKGINHSGKHILEIQTDFLWCQKLLRIGRIYMTLLFFTLLEKFDVIKQ